MPSRPRQIITGIALAILAAVYAIKMVFIGHYRIPQNGMYPGLPAGSSLWAYRHAYTSPAGVKRGDVILFTRKDDSEEYVYIWRVIGLPGDKIQTSGESVVLNGETVQRQKVREADGKVIYREQLGNVSYEVAFDVTPLEPASDFSTNVPPGQFFVMGDNRFVARDSRYFGPIPFDSIIGKKF